MFALLLFIVLSPQETGIVYFYRVEEAPRIESQRVAVYLDGKHAVSLPEEQFVGVRLPAGEYVARMKPRKSETLLRITPGKPIFIRVSRVSKGLSGFDESLTVVDAEQALFQMRDMKPLEAKNIKDKAREAVTTLPAP